MLSTNIKAFSVAINPSLSNRKGPRHSSSATMFLRVLRASILHYAGSERSRCQSVSRVHAIFKLLLTSVRSSVVEKSNVLCMHCHIARKYFSESWLVKQFLPLRRTMMWADWVFPCRDMKDSFLLTWQKRCNLVLIFSGQKIRVIHEWRQTLLQAATVKSINR